MTTILDLFGAPEETPVEPEALPEDPKERRAELLRRAQKLSLPDLVYRTNAQERLESEILTHYDAAFPKSKVQVPPLAEKNEHGVRTGPAFIERWHAVRALGNKLSDTLVDQLLEKYRTEIDEHEQARKLEAAALRETADFIETNRLLDERVKNP